MSYGDIVEDILDAEIDKTYQERKARRKIKDKFSASNAGYCMRATVLNRLGANEVDKSAKEKRILWIGTVLHKAVEEVLKKSGKLTPSSEKFINPQGSYVWGTPDFILKDGVATLLLDEMKSIGTGSFWTKVVKNKKPHLHHVYQVVTYYLLLKSVGEHVQSVKVTYLSKQDAAMRSFWINITPELVNDVQEWWATVNDYYEKSELPPVFEVGSDDYKDKCKTCTFRTLYCFGEETEVPLEAEKRINLNIQELKWPDQKTSGIELPKKVS